MTTIDQLKKDRFQFLNLLYEKTGGDKYASVNMNDIGKELGFDKQKINTITQYLVGEMLMEHTAIGGSIGITHDGVKEVEAALSSPDKPTHYFPPVNIININHMEGSQILQGSTNSTQSGSFEINNNPNIIEFIDKLKKEIPNIDLTHDDKSEISADVATIETQIGSSRPKNSILCECFGSIKRILEGASGSIIATQLLQSLSAILTTLK